MKNTYKTDTAKRLVKTDIFFIPSVEDHLRKAVFNIFFFFLVFITILSRLKDK